MRQTRILLAVFTLSLTLVLSLMRPLPSRAEEPGPSAEPTPTSVEDPPDPAPLPGAAARSLARPARKLADAHKALSFGARVVGFAKHLLGTPYRYGGTSPSSGFDCSGFVRYVFSHFGVSLPHSSFADMVLGRSVDRSHLRPGDLVFFDSAGHVGIYIGGGRFIHAPHTGTVVRITTMDGWYSSRFTGARRVH